MPQTLVLNFGEVYTPFHRLKEASIYVEGGVVKKIKPYWAENAENYKEYIAAPAYVDTHTHGCCGIDVNTAKDRDLVKLARELTRFGVGAFVPTTVTAPHEELLRMCEIVGSLETSGGEGAEILGLHLEGPYINPEKRGAQNPEFIRKPSVAEFEEYYRASKGKLLIVDVAPELEGSSELIREARLRGVHVGMGHTNATYEEAVRAIALGCDRAVHIFNGMRVFHHREPGVVLAALESPQVYIEIIADFIHLHPATVRFVTNFAGWHRVMLVTDSISASMLPDGVYNLGGLKVIVEKGVARLENGSLAGSTLTMDRAVRNIYSLVGDLGAALAMASYIPARSVDKNSYGCLAPGCAANIVVLNRDLGVEATFVRGEKIFSRR